MFPLPFSITSAVTGYISKGVILVLSIAVVGLSILSYTQSNTIQSKDQTIGSLTTQLETAQKAIKDRDFAIQQQNSAVDEMAKKSQEAKKLAEEAVRKAREDSRKDYEKAVTVLRKGSSKDSCTDSNSLLNDAINQAAGNNL